MTKQTPYECDWCFEIIHVPQRSLHPLTIDFGTTDEQKWDICSECYDKFMEFLSKEIFPDVEDEKP